MECRQCGAENLDGAKKCIECGEPLRPARVSDDTAGDGHTTHPPDEASGGSRSTAIVVGVGIALFALMAGVFMFTGSGGGGGAGGASVAGQAGWVASPTTEALGADSPVATAILLAGRGWSSGAAVVVLVSEEDAAAAAIAAPLAAGVGGPVLLSRSAAVDAEVLAELRVLRAKKVYVLDSGGHAGTFAAALESAGFKVKHLSAPDASRLSELATREIKALGPIRGVVLARADASDRAVVSAGYAAAAGYPVVFSDASGSWSPHAATLKQLRPLEVVVLESSATANVQVLGDAGLAGTSADWIDGASLPAFSKVFAEYTFGHGFEYGTVYAVRTGSIAHAYASGPFAALTRSPLIVTEDDALGAEARSFFVGHASSIGDVVSIGPGGGTIDKLLSEAKIAAETRISAAAVPLSGAEAEKVTAVTSTTVTFRADGDIEQRLTEGKIIVSGPSAAAPDGFLRRIVSLSRNGDTMAAQTEPASLGDVVLKGSYDIRVSADTTASPTRVVLDIGGERVTVPADSHVVPEPTLLGGTFTRVGRTNTRTSRTDPLVVKLPWPGLEVKTPEIRVPGEPTYAQFELKARLTESWKVWVVLSSSWEEQPGFLQADKLVRFSMVSYVEHHVALDYEVGASVGYGGKREGDQTKITEILKKFAPQALRKDATLPGPSVRSVFMIYVIPVVLDSYLEPYAIASGSVKGTLKGRLESHIRYTFGGEIDLTRRSLKPILDVTDLSPDPKAPTVVGSAELKIAGGVKLGTRFYGLIGPYVRGEAYAKGKFIERPLAGEPPTSTVQLMLGLEGTIGGDLKIGSLKVGSLEFPPISRDWPLWSSPLVSGAGGGGSSGGGGGGGGGGASGGAGANNTTLVIDRSSSMANPYTKIEGARAAAQTVVDILEGATAASRARVNIGIVEFNANSDVLLDPTDDYDSVRSTVKGIEPIDGTDLLKPIQLATEQLESSGGGSMILLTDGVDENGNSDEDIVGAADEARSRGITIFTIGFGTPGYDINEVLLKRIAGSDARYSYADPKSLVGLAGGFLYSQMASSSDVRLKEEGTVRQGQTVEAGGFEIDAEGDLQAVLYWPGSTLEIRLTDPAGTEVASGYPGLEVSRKKSPAQLFISNPKPGRWTMSVYGAKTSMTDEPFYALAGFKASPVATPSVAPTATVPTTAVGGGAPPTETTGMFLFIIVLLFGGAVGYVLVGRRAAGAVEPPSTDSSESGSAELPGFALVSAAGMRFPLRPGANTVGRSSGSDVFIDDASVSREHAVIEVDDGVVAICDLGSTAGTRRNGTPILSGGLRPGDRIEFADAAFTLVPAEPDRSDTGGSPK